MPTIKARLLLPLLLVAPAATAQVVVLVHRPSGKTAIVENLPNPRGLALYTSMEKLVAPDWEPLIASDTLGYGAMFCFRRNGKTEFFVQSGRATSEDAIRDARASAYKSAPAKETPYWCGRWKNTNKYGMDANAAATTRNIGNVLVHMTGGKLGGRLVAHVRLLNLSKTAASAVMFSGVASDRPRVVVLQPRQSMNVPLGKGDSFTLSVAELGGGVEPQPDKSIFDQVKNVIREEVTGGKFKVPTAVGVRG